MSTNRVLFLSASVVLSVLSSACAPPDRGSWWYRHPSAGDPYGIEEVFAGTGALTPTQAADDALACGVKRLYGSYGSLSTNPTAAQAAQFNVDLHSRGMTSEVLFSDSSYLTNPAALLTNVTDRVLDFNAAHSATGEQFDAVHLDVEPVDYPECKTATLDPAGCYRRVGELLSLIQDVSELVSGATPAVRVYVDLHEWIDLTDPVQGARVGWPADPTPEASRDDWFTTLDVWVDGVTVFAYSHTDPNDVWNAVSYEATNLSKEVRAGINLDPATSFPDVPSMLATALLVETSHAIPVDLHSVNDVFAAGGC